MLTSNLVPSNGTSTIDAKPSRVSYEAAATPTIDLQESLLELAIRMMRKYWWVLFAGATLAAITAYLAAEKFSSTSSVVKARAMYVPLPKLPGSDSFRAPDTGTVTGILQSSKCLNSLAEKHALPSAAGVSRSLRVQSSNNSPFIDLTINWPESDQGAALVNDVVRIASAELTSQTRRTLEQYVQVTQASVRSADVLVEEARARLADFYVANPTILDHYEEGEESQLSTAPVGSMSIPSQVARAELQHANLMSKKELLSNQLVHLEEKLRQDLLEACEKQISVIRGLTADTPAAKAHVDSIAKKFANLQASYEDDFDGWKLALSNLVMQSFGRNASFIELPLSLSEKKLEAITSQQEQVEIDCALAAAELANLRDRLDVTGQDTQSEISSFPSDSPELAGSNADHEVLKSNLIMKVRSRGVMDDRLKALQELLKSDHVGLSLLEPAESSAAVEKTSWKKVFALAFTSILGLSCCGVLLYEDRTGNRHAAYTLANRLGLPTLGSLARRPADSEANRLFALRLRRSIDQSHAVIAFSELDGNSGKLRDRLLALAENLAIGGDRILVVNVTHGVSFSANDGTTSLHETKPRRTSNDLVDQLEIGTDTPWANNFRLDSASVVDHLRDDYDFVLVAAPSLKKAADVELVSATSDALCLCARNQRHLASEARVTAAELGQTVSILGLVQLM